jgi:hypothetical protein
MKILDIPQSGKCGTFVSVRTRYGQVRRRRGVIRKSPSPAQLRHRAKFGGVRALWRTLNPEQRITWAPGPEDIRSRPRVGQSGVLPAYLIFVKVNATLAAQGLPPVLTRPPCPSFDANPVGELVSTNTDGTVELKLSVPSAPATDIIVLGTDPRSAGVSFANHFTILGPLPAAEAGYSNITQLYVDRYGVPPAGTRVFIRTRQVRDGWADYPIQTNAVVPRQ